MTTNTKKTQVLIVVDVQRDFCAGGALAVPRGDEVVPAINGCTRHFEHVVFTQDWHPPGHLSFVSSHAERKPFETVELSGVAQILWPDHCVQGTPGARFHADLDTSRGELILRKGFHRELDSYSAFFENDHKTPTGLGAYLRERGVNQLVFAGLATDYCVLYSVLDALGQQFTVSVIEDACRGIGFKGSDTSAWKAMAEAGAEIIASNSISGEQ